MLSLNLGLGNGMGELSLPFSSFDNLEIKCCLKFEFFKFGVASGVLPGIV